MVDLELRRYQSTNFEPSTNFVMGFSSISEIVDTYLQYFFSTEPNLQILECLQFFDCLQILEIDVAKFVDTIYKF